MTNMTDYEKYRPYINFIRNYQQAQNASTGSAVDSNANVENKNVTTCTGELPKKDFIGVNRLLMQDKLKELYGEDIANSYFEQLDNHKIYKHDETQPLLPYCVSITMYPFLFDGMEKIGGISDAPKNLQSFCGSFINLVFAIAAQFAGAVSTPEFLTYMDYFLRLEYGDDYYTRGNEVVELTTKRRTLDEVIYQYWQQVIYSLNQPAAARNYQCVREDTTQLWTPDGFKYLSELKEGDECYVWKDGEIKIDTIKHLNVYDYDDELIQFTGNNYQQTVTPNHRIVYKKTDGSNTYAIREAHEMYNHSKLSMPICGNNNFEDYPMNDDMLRVCTYALTDGSLTKPSDPSHIHAHTTLTYYMSPNRKGYQEVIDGLTHLGIGFTVKESPSNKFGKVNIINVPPIEASSICNALENTKKRLPGFYKQLSQRQAQLVLDYWSKSDGQKLCSKEENTRLKLQCDNMEIADALQTVCLLAGLGSTISIEQSNSFDGTKKVNTIYVKTFSRDCKRITKYNKIHYKGRVWCPTTDTGIVIFREENKTPYISGNSVFWNIAYFDRKYFEGLFEDFVFPDGSKPKFESVMWLQKKFMKWFNQERLRKVLTFPVETVNLLSGTDEQGEPFFDDDDFADFVAEMWSNGHSFFMYTSDSVDSLASCCRLRNELQDNTFSYTLGAGGVSTGSKSVITINFNRLVQDIYPDPAEYKTNPEKLDTAIREEIKLVHKFLIAYNENLKDSLKAKLLPIYDAGYISMDKQFLTIGINGLVEGAEYLGIEISPNEDYFNYCTNCLKPIYEENKRAKTKELMFNTEYVPAENLGVKNAKWDKEDGYFSPRDCYNSYFYRPDDPTISIIDKFILHGKKTTQWLDGGSALHLNLDEHLTKEQYKKLMCIAVKTGCSYFTFNIPNTVCNNCGHISKHKFNKCPRCSSENVDWATRIIGYLKLISKFSSQRQIEADKRYYADGSNL